MRRSIFLILLTITTFSFISSMPKTTLADRRNFAWSYEYKTMSKGELELENYFTPKVNSVDDETETSWEHWLELEYGLTDKTDVSLYQMFKQKHKSALQYNGYKIRARHRFGTLGQYPLDPLIYLEFIQKPDEIEFEQKIVLAKNLDKTFFAINFTFEQAIEEEEENGEKEEKETELELAFNPSFGIGYQVSPNLSLSLEFLNKNKISEGEVKNPALFAGPTISWATEKGWWTLNFLPLINRTEDVKKAHDEFMVRSLIGIFF